MAAILRDSTVVVAVVVVVRTRPRAIPLAMITMRKSTHGFPFVSHMSMGLRLAALRAAGAPLLLPLLAVIKIDKVRSIPGWGGRFACRVCHRQQKCDTAEPPVAINSRKWPPLLSDQFSKIPKISKSDHCVKFVWNNSYLYCGCRCRKVKCDHRSKFSNLSNWKEDPNRPQNKMGSLWHFSHWTDWNTLWN